MRRPCPSCGPGEERGHCPTCGKPVILVYDSDEGRAWLHEMWRSCSCPVPTDVSEYLDDHAPGMGGFITLN